MIKKLLLRIPALLPLFALLTLFTLLSVSPTQAMLSEDEHRGGGPGVALAAPEHAKRKAEEERIHQVFEGQLGALRQQKDELAHQLTLMEGEQERVKQEKDILTQEKGILAREKDVLTQQVAALTERLRALEARPSTTLAQVAPSTGPYFPAAAGGAGGGGGVMIQISRPFADEIAVYTIPREFEYIYDKFVRGKLIYKPDPKSDQGRIELPISAFVNPLEGEFDLSGCGDSGQYLSINTGYRKGIKPANSFKWEIWLAPRFLIEKELRSSAKHFQPIMENWNRSAAPVGLFWTWGGRDDLGDYDYLTNESLEEVSNDNLSEKHRKITEQDTGNRRRPGLQLRTSNFMFCL